MFFTFHYSILTLYILFAALYHTFISMWLITDIAEKVLKYLKSIISYERIINS